MHRRSLTHGKQQQTDKEPEEERRREKIVKYKTRKKYSSEWAAKMQATVRMAFLTEANTKQNKKNPSNFAGQKLRKSALIKWLD